MRIMGKPFISVFPTHIKERKITMNKKKTNTLILIASVGLAIAGIIFLCVAIFGETKSNWPLSSALVCVVLSNLFNVIRASFNKKEK